MDLILLGFGKMNRLVSELAAERGDRVVKTVDNPSEWGSGWSPGLVAIDFSVPDAVVSNLDRCMDAGIPVVIGTTGWYAHLDDVRRRVDAAPVGAVYGANFSVGVQAFYRIVREAARALPHLWPGGYDAFVSETHHRQKLDAPSGTAAHLAALIAAQGRPAPVPVSIRAGANPGAHTVGFEGADDLIVLTHNARSRRGFAAGALLAARWILGRRGLHEYSEVMDSFMAGELK